VRLLNAIERAQRRRIPLFVAGVGLEAAVMTLIGADDGIRGIRGVGGETAALLAVAGAVFAGPWVGVAMATVGWSLFFPLVAHSHAWSVVALPEWLGAAYLTGVLSAALLRAERARAESELHRRAAHALRAPIATIHGLVAVLRRDRTHEEQIVRAIEDETGRLLESPVFEEQPG
jgi:hypothetical protein